MQDSDRKSAIILSAIGIVPVVWLSLLIAPFVKGGLTEIVTGLMKSFEHPFQIQLCEDSLKTVLFLLAAYAMGIGIYFSTRRNYRRRGSTGATSTRWSAVDRALVKPDSTVSQTLCNAIRRLSFSILKVRYSVTQADCLKQRGMRCVCST